MDEVSEPKNANGTPDMNPEEFVRLGELDNALESLQAQIRSNPAEPKLRTFLFQLLCVQGDWQRAIKQLDVLGDMDPIAMPMVHTYRDAVLCEMLRSEIFAGRRSPLIFGEPEPWMARMIEALNPDASQTAVNEQRLEALEDAPATSGTIDGKAFSWIADADSRLGPLLEVVTNGKYFWIPFSRIAAIKIEEPADLRDAVWTPGHFTWANGGEAVGLIPTRYAGSEASSDASLQLARSTGWEEVGEGLYQGLGQRTLATDEQDYALMDCREISFNTEA
jgi:type VI secretion system protein ImpE